MATPYDIVVRQVALRINAFSNATQPADLQTAYVTALTSAVVGESESFPFSAIQDAVLDAEQKLAQTIAEVKDHAWRQVLISETAALASGATIPAVDSAGKSIIGVYGAVFDATDSDSLNEQPAEVIERRLRSSAIWKIPVYQYAIKGDSIVHTRTTVKIEVCVWDYTTQAAAIVANGNMLLPDVLMEALICGAIALLVRDDEFTTQAGVYAEYFAETIKAIRGGATNLPVKEAA